MIRKTKSRDRRRNKSRKVKSKDEAIKVGVEAEKKSSQQIALKNDQKQTPEGGRIICSTLWTGENLIKKISFFGRI